MNETIIHNDFSYNIVYRWRSDEYLAYRDMPYGRVEMLDCFCGVTKTTIFHPTFMKMVMDKREYDKEVAAIEAQEALNAELEQAVGSPAA